MTPPTDGILVLNAGSSSIKFALFDRRGDDCFRNRQIACRLHAHEHGVDPPEIVAWRWPAA